jgi:hypothetical protein
MTAGITLKKLPQIGPVKKGTKPKPAKKRAKKKAAPAGPIVLTAAQDVFLEQVTQEGMARMRWSRAYAERKARKFLSKANTPAKLNMVAARLGRLDDPPATPAPRPLPKKAPEKVKPSKAKPKPAAKMTRAAIAKLPPVDPPKPPPRTALQRLERALGPDDGKRRRGGSPVVQGGSPGRGKRR